MGVKPYKGRSEKKDLGRCTRVYVYLCVYFILTLFVTKGFDNFRYGRK